MIRLSSIHKSFYANGARQSVLEDVSFDIPEGGFVSLFGPNGCGKTTLLSILGGLQRQDSGVVTGLGLSRGGVGIVFQDYRRTLLPWKNVEENIIFPLLLQGVDRRKARSRLQNLLDITQVELNLSQRIFELSGGQAQMAGLLRALIIEPKLLILDEPFSALDYILTLTLRQKLMRIVTDLGLTTLLVSHDLEEALYLGDRVIFLTRKPCRCHSVLEVPYPRPREVELLASASFAKLKLAAIEAVEECSGEKLRRQKIEPPRRDSNQNLFRAAAKL